MALKGIPFRDEIAAKGSWRVFGHFQGHPLRCCHHDSLRNWQSERILEDLHR